MRRRYRKKRRRSRSKAIPIVPVIAGLAPGINAYNAAGGVEGLMSNPTEFGRQVIGKYTGYDINTGQWDMGQLVNNMILWFGAGAVHMIANKTVNRYIHRIPYFGKYISI